jgi:hypothetical protein
LDGNQLAASSREHVVRVSLCLCGAVDFYGEYWMFRELRSLRVV